MKRKFLDIILPVLIILLAGCAGTPAAAPVIVLTATQPPATPTISATPDPCAPGQIEEAAQRINKHMREFDDASLLASNVPQNQLGDSIASLQKVRREAEDEPAPSCLSDLKTYQIDHMNSVINTLTAFMGGTDQKTVDQGITIARQQHDQYMIELGRILGLPVVPAAGIPTETPTP